MVDLVPWKACGWARLMPGRGGIRSRLRSKQLWSGGEAASRNDTTQRADANKAIRHTPKKQHPTCSDLVQCPIFLGGLHSPVVGGKNKSIWNQCTALD